MYRILRPSSSSLTTFFAQVKSLDIIIGGEAPKHNRRTNLSSDWSAYCIGFLNGRF
ncbi:Uncharacterised protein [Porphyromonas cangingivalis]|nr:Uncharacterised protein [Porphyromonas cangingivalis]